MESICGHLRASSEYVRNWIASQPGVKEESLTDWLLYDVSQRLPKVHYVAFTRHDEGRNTGADWEWWIILRKGAVRFRVQAKKLVVSDNYPIIASANKYGLQIDKLLSSASGANAIPLYGFYSPIKSFGMCGMPESQEAGGVFLAGARKIYQELFAGPKRAVHAGELLAMSNPFSCFACCKLFSEHKGSLREYLRQYYAIDTEAPTIAEDSFPGFHERAPEYVTSFLTLVAGSVLGRSPEIWQKEFASQTQEFNALLIYDFRNDES